MSDEEGVTENMSSIRVTDKKTLKTLKKSPDGGKKNKLINELITKLTETFAVIQESDSSVAKMGLDLYLKRALVRFDNNTYTGDQISTGEAISSYVEKPTGTMFGGNSLLTVGFKVRGRADMLTDLGNYIVNDTPSNPNSALIPHVISAYMGQGLAVFDMWETVKVMALFHCQLELNRHRMVLGAIDTKVGFESNRISIIRCDDDLECCNVSINIRLQNQKDTVKYMLDYTLKTIFNAMVDLKSLIGWLGVGYFNEIYLDNNNMLPSYLFEKFIKLIPLDMFITTVTSRTSVSNIKIEDGETTNDATGVLKETANRVFDEIIAYKYFVEDTHDEICVDASLRATVYRTRANDWQEKHRDKSEFLRVMLALNKYYFTSNHHEDQILLYKTTRAPNGSETTQVTEPTIFMNCMNFTQKNKSTPHYQNMANYFQADDKVPFLKVIFEFNNQFESKGGGDDKKMYYGRKKSERMEEISWILKSCRLMYFRCINNTMDGKKVKLSYVIEPVTFSYDKCSRLYNMINKSNKRSKKKIVDEGKPIVITDHDVDSDNYCYGSEEEDENNVLNDRRCTRKNLIRKISHAIGWQNG